MYVKILYDNKAKRGLVSGHGFSCLVGGKILFDTGEASASLLENMHRLVVDPEQLEGVVISHDHWDHTGGLWEILKNRKGLKVYVCPSSGDILKDCIRELGGDLVEVAEPLEVAKGIYVTGEIMGKYKDERIAEQALVVKGEKGTSVITGCAHPGIVRVLKHIERIMGLKDPYMLMGGFHLRDMDREGIGRVIADIRDLGVVKTAPSHCSGDRAMRMFSGRFPGGFVPVRAGQIIQL
ncbi:MAG: MBL fold metallo-hydrolase [Candidatus Omnitrophica bacterium]|nr:MBL fold metallo-hydrolase [Candidatus Omnitrophota bacterium]